MKNWGFDENGEIRIVDQPEIGVDFQPEVDWSDSDWDIFSRWVRGVLTVQPVTITFTKKDGSERVMSCTLREDMLPKQEVTEDKTPRKKSENTLAVYDLEANGWRSFTIRSVKRVEFAID